MEKEKKHIKSDRFSEKESIAGYTPIIYEINKVVNGKNTRIIVGSYCSHYDKTNCKCLK